MVCGGWVACTAARAPLPRGRLSSNSWHTRAPQPSRSISISLNPVSSSSLASSRISSWSTPALPLLFEHPLRRFLLDLFGPHAFCFPSVWRLRCLRSWQAGRPWLRSRVRTPWGRTRRLHLGPPATQGGVSKGLTPEHIRQVQLDHRPVGGIQGIENGHPRMGIRTCV